MRILITGGTVFVSKFMADYFVKRGDEVYVLNRGTRKQVPGVNLIKADRHNLKDQLKNLSFDFVIDVCSYDKQDIVDLLMALGNFKDYLLISSSAVYPETNQQPFSEEQTIGPNSIWGQYGTDKIEAEKYLLEKVPNAYIIRPAYIYGPMQNVYREPFVFECALKNRKFYLPKDGKLKLQFIHVEDLARMIVRIMELHPPKYIYNAGNEELVDLNTFVTMCYQIAKTPLEIVYVNNHENQRDYFSFYDYQYCLDVSRQKQLIKTTKNLYDGLDESFRYYRDHQDEVVKKNYLDFIDQNLK